MKSQLRNLLLRGYPLEVKQEILNSSHKIGKKLTIEKYNITPSTLNRLLFFEKEILEATQEYINTIKQPKRVRSEEYRKKYKEKFNPKNRRKKHPLKVIANYANSNYKLVCFRKEINQWSESDLITANDLFKIAKKQKRKCALSGIKLESDFVSVDHIKPISNGGRNIPSNIRLVDSRINKMRNNMSDKEFLFLCENVVLTLKN